MWAGVGGRGAGPGVGGLEGVLRWIAGFGWTVAAAVEIVICFVLPLEGGGR